MINAKQTLLSYFHNVERVYFSTEAGAFVRLNGSLLYWNKSKCVAKAVFSLDSSAIII